MIYPWYVISKLCEDGNMKPWRQFSAALHVRREFANHFLDLYSAATDVMNMIRSVQVLPQK